jgi:hypothetical protein
MRNAYKMLVGKPEGKTSLGRRWHRREDCSKMDVGEMGVEGVDCIPLAQVRDPWRNLVNTVPFNLLQTHMVGFFWAFKLH